jgi:hypothetical protein
MSYKYFFGAPPLLFLYTRYAPVTMICTATAIKRKVVILGPELVTTMGIMVSIYSETSGMR